MIATQGIPLRAPVRPSKPIWAISAHQSPRDRFDTRTAPHCKRCGAVGEPEDVCCWKCGGEEMQTAAGAVA